MSAAIDHVPRYGSETRDDRPREDHFVQLHGVSWEDYERVLAIRGDRSVPRICYLEGTLEMMSPARPHENIKSLLGRLFEAWCLERDIAFTTVGSWTLKRQEDERGVEADESYVFGDDPDETTWPHVAIEVEWTSGGLNKLEIYRVLGTEEVWWWRKGSLQVYVLQGDNYVAAARSERFPDLDLDLLVSFIDRPTTSQAIRDYRDVLRGVVTSAPR